jgi:hypothetical protein
MELTQFRNSEAFQESYPKEDTEIRIRLLVLEERLDDRDRKIARLESALFRRSQVHESSSSEALLGRVADLEAEVLSLRTVLAGMMSGGLPSVSPTAAPPRADGGGHARVVPPPAYPSSFPPPTFSAPGGEWPSRVSDRRTAARGQQVRGEEGCTRRKEGPRSPLSSVPERPTAAGAGFPDREECSPQ